ncbi:MAG: neutral/alkaline non-lysosomal ceramidase N-terminal domain-containing protein [Erysipelotrichaceae bacterium]|nr:neutral/alkaline non-lysosomal ceramidase N-terminal domain-containing protein [Erysipelotrichaceae bacterium]
MIKFASASKQVIPADPYYLMGYAGPVREQPALGIHDIPEVNTLCIAVNDRPLIICVVDVCIISKTKSDLIKARLQARYGLEAEQISLIAIHSHSCPNGTGSPNRGFNKQLVNEPFYQMVSGAIEATVGSCLASLQTATAEYQSTMIDGYFSNRNDLKAPYDNQAISIHFYDINHHLLGILFNIACHSTVLGPTNMYCSSDLIGTIRSKLKNHYQTNVVAAMATAGDISTRQYRQGDDFNELERCAKGITEQLLKDPKSVKLELSQLKIKQLKHVIDFDNRPFYPRYRQLLAETKALLADPHISKDQYKLSLTSSIKFENILKVEQVHKEVFTKVYDLGSLKLIGFGGELSSKFGLAIKRACPNALVMIMTCCDDHEGYFIEAEKYGLYYETIASDIPQGDPEKITTSIIESLK